MISENYYVAAIAKRLLVRYQESALFVIFTCLSWHPTNNLRTMTAKYNIPVFIFMHHLLVYIFTEPNSLQQNFQEVILSQLRTSVSASRKTHLEYCVRRQQCSFVNVTPSSGRDNSSRFTASWLSRTSTTVTRSKTDLRFSLQQNVENKTLIHINKTLFGNPIPHKMVSWYWNVPQ